MTRVSAERPSIRAADRSFDCRLLGHGEGWTFGSRRARDAPRTKSDDQLAQDNTDPPTGLKARLVRAGRFDNDRDRREKEGLDGRAAPRRREKGALTTGFFSPGWFGAAWSRACASEKPLGAKDAVNRPGPGLPSEKCAIPGGRLLSGQPPAGNVGRSTSTDGNRTERTIGSPSASQKCTTLGPKTT